jgi:hypothetical protein
MLAVEPVRAQVLQVVGDASRLGVVVQMLDTRAVLRCHVAARNRAFAATLRHKSHKCEQIVILRVVNYHPPDLIVELEPDTQGAQADCGAEAEQIAEFSEPVEPVERRRAFLAPLATC